MNQKFLPNKNSNFLFLILLYFPVIFLTMFLGCGPTINFMQTGPSIVAKSNDCLIEVFNSTIPERKYKELGILESDGGIGFNMFEDVLPKLKKEACQKGGDAIIIKSIQKYVSDKDDRHIYVTATVIKWVD